jgi:hypothetical protein
VSLPTPQPKSSAFSRGSSGRDGGGRIEHVSHVRRTGFEELAARVFAQRTTVIAIVRQDSEIRVVPSRSSPRCPCRDNSKPQTQAATYATAVFPLPRSQLSALRPEDAIGFASDDGGCSDSRSVADVRADAAACPAIGWADPASAVQASTAHAAAANASAPRAGPDRSSLRLRLRSSEVRQRQLRDLLAQHLLDVSHQPGFIRPPTTPRLPVAPARPVRPMRCT